MEYISKRQAKKAVKIALLKNPSNSEIQNFIFREINKNKGKKSKERTGEWILDGHAALCSNCNTLFSSGELYGLVPVDEENQFAHYCPACGSKKTPTTYNEKFEYKER